MFRKDLLQHEAHRHPYLERIGTMYMMKLRHGEKFGREANTSWRLLFVFAVSHLLIHIIIIIIIMLYFLHMFLIHMPILHKYVSSTTMISVDALA